MLEITQVRKLSICTERHTCSETVMWWYDEDDVEAHPPAGGGLPPATPQESKRGALPGALHGL